jgi:thymidine kinase
MAYRYAAQRTETVSAYCPVCRVKTFEAIKTPYDMRWLINDNQLACSIAHTEQYIAMCAEQFEKDGL